MHSENENLVIPQKGALIGIVFSPLLLLAFASAMLHIGINPLWWVPFELLLTYIFYVALFGMPKQYNFHLESEVLFIEYRLGELLKKNESVPFREIQSVQSRAHFVGDNDPRIDLELKLHNKRRIILQSAIPDWDSTFCLGLSSALEPKEVEGFRHRVSSLTGAKNLGFLRPPPIL